MYILTAVAIIPLFLQYAFYSFYDFNAQFAYVFVKYMCLWKSARSRGVITQYANINKAAVMLQWCFLVFVEPNYDISLRLGTDVSELQDGTAMSLRSRLSQKVLQNTPLPAKLNPTDGEVFSADISLFHH